MRHIYMLQLMEVNAGFTYRLVNIQTWNSLISNLSRVPRSGENILSMYVCKAQITDLVILVVQPAGLFGTEPCSPHPVIQASLIA